MSEVDVINIGVFGEHSTGKTSISLRYIKDEYAEGYISTIEDEFEKDLEINNQKVHISLRELSGQIDFSELRDKHYDYYYNQVDGYLLLFDISNPDSIDYLKSIYQDIKEIKKEEEIIFAIAANKSDVGEQYMHDIITTKDYKSIEEYCQSKVFEVSCKTGKNVNEIFTYLILQILTKRNEKSAITNEKSNQ